MHKELSDTEKLRIYLSLLQRQDSKTGRDPLDDILKTLLRDDIDYFETFVHPQRLVALSERIKYEQELVEIHGFLEQNEENKNDKLSSSPIFKKLGEHSLHFFDNLPKNRSGSRKVFRTNLGDYGFAADGVEPGDILFCVMTSAVPLILRERVKREPVEYALVAEAYLYSFIHGEMMDEGHGFDNSVRPISIT